MVDALWLLIRVPSPEESRILVSVSVVLLGEEERRTMSEVSGMERDLIKK